MMQAGTIWGTRAKTCRARLKMRAATARITRTPSRRTWTRSRRPALSLPGCTDSRRAVPRAPRCSRVNGCTRSASKISRSSTIRIFPCRCSTRCYHSGCASRRATALTASANGTSATATRSTCPGRAVSTTSWATSQVARRTRPTRCASRSPGRPPACVPLVTCALLPGGHLPSAQQNRRPARH